MSESLREVNLTPAFLDGLAAIQAYHSQFDAARGRQTSTSIIDFACDIIAPFPQAHPHYPVRQYPERDYWRAVFRREYVLIYRVTDAEISFLLIYGARQRPNDLLLPA
ncbi:type II toxin-antitoxin system RelE/ParE family toxin [Hymenobacter sp. IS2118]|uniref:type II toxin-antitoxin system RelE/ParE family toxin n=1 Tax=Hymenobacter sp. IS2118 TaxID=1505605 RepID=UPI000550CB43|nr:type II toxin-antitoxin system RelE/ParE family toxin [Hymenobacter sp. IS2118]